MTHDTRDPAEPTPAQLFGFYVFLFIGTIMLADMFSGRDE
jgi:hypothetical protein